MDNAWIALVLVSAAIHPIRDLTLKGVAHPVSCYTGVSFSWIVFAAIQAQATGQSLHLPPEVWPLVFMSAFGLALYYYGTLAALRRGNLSVYYPIIRSAPVAIVVISWLLFDQSYSWAVLLGITLVMAGSLMIQKSPGGFLHDPKAFALAVLAMLGSAFYSLSDAAAMQATSPAPFLFYTYIVLTGLLAAIRAWEDRHMRSPLSGLLRGWITSPWRILIAGLASYVSYIFILNAFQLGAEAAPVTAVRQASIPVSVILAALILKEPRFLHRIGWASLIAIGILCIGLL